MKKISFLRKIRRKIKDKLPKSLRDFIDKLLNETGKVGEYDQKI